MVHLQLTKKTMELTGCGESLIVGCDDFQQCVRVDL